MKKFIYYTFLIALWVILICLSLEVGTRLFLKLANYVYKPYFDMQNRKVYRMIPLEEQKKQLSSKVDISPRNKLIIPEIKNNAYTQTGNFSYSCKKEYELALEGIMEAQFDKNGNLIESCGEPLIERAIIDLLQGTPFGYYDPDWGTLKEKLKQPPEEPFSIQLKYMMIYNLQYNIDIRPNNNGFTLLARLIKDDFPYSLNHPSTPISDETQWLIHWYAYKPNFKANPPAPSTNNFGFRDEDIILPKPKNLFRIVCVGGSTTEEGNDLYSSYPNLLEKKLKDYFNTTNIDVINCGICAIRSWGERLRVNDYLQFEPNLLLYYNGINDLCYPDIAYWITVPNKYKKILSKSMFLNRIFNRYLLPRDEYIAEYLRKTTIRNLGAILCACRKNNVEMAICSFAYPKLKWYEFIKKMYCDFNMRNAWLIMLDVDITYATYLHVLNIYNDELKKFCKEEGIPYIPVAENMNVGLDHFCDICHTTRLGIEEKSNIIAQYIAQWLERKNIFQKDMENN